MHGHLTGVEIDAKDFGSLNKFFEGCHIVLTHQVAEDLGTRTKEVKATCGSDFQSAHHKAEDLRQPIAAGKASSLFLFDSVESPEGKEDIHFISHCSRART